MKNFKNFDGLFCGLLLLFTGLCCLTKPTTSSHKNFCITPDGSRIGFMGWNGTAFLIDGETGKILNSADDSETTSGAVVCTDDNEIVAVYNEFAVRLVDGKRVERAHTYGSIIGLTRDERLIAYTGGQSASAESNAGRPLRLYESKIDEKSEQAKSVMVPFEKFEGLRSGANYYYILPVSFLRSGEILVAAGAVPRSYQYGVEAKISPEAWGFFLVNPQTGEVRPHGTAKTGDVEINFLDPPRVYSTPDGRFLALLSGYHTGNAVAVFDAETDREIFREVMPDDFEIVDAVFSEDGKQLALAVRHNRPMRGGMRVFYDAKIYDLGARKEINAFSLKNNMPYLIDFRDGKLVVNHYPDLVSKMDAQTAQIVWETILPGRK
jgi:hypothetical protein